MLRSEQVDAVVIGMGPAGERVANRLADAGLKVAGIEERLVGGECAYWGCVPTKMMLRAAEVLAEGRRVEDLAGGSRLDPDWTPLAKRVRDATKDWDDAAAVKRFTDKGGVFVRGRGRIVDDGEVEAAGRRFAPERAVVVATGTTPATPPVEGLRATPYWTNRDAVEAAELPRSLAVLGGGSVGVELGQTFQRFGCDVTLIESADRLLPSEEPEAGRIVAKALREDGMTIHVATRTTEARHEAGVFALTTEDHGTVAADRLLVAVGRRPAVQDLGLDQAGMQTVDGVLPTGEKLRAGNGVWAVGDVTGHGGFTHVALYEADIAVRDILGDSEGPAADYKAVPRLTFTDPEVGSVGMTEKMARDAGLPVQTLVTEDSTRGWIHHAGDRVSLKLIVDTRRGVLIGATCVGPAAGEVLFGLTLAVATEVPVERLKNVILAYPTFHRDVLAAVDQLS